VTFGMSQATAAPPAPPPRPAAAPPPPKPEPIRAKRFASQVMAKFPDVKVEWMKERRLKLSTTPDKIKEVGLFVRDSLGFDHISTVSAVDWIAKNELENIYFIASTRLGLEDFVLALSERVPRTDPVLPTMIDVWKGVEFHERETHEMFGIDFQGHPNQNHILLPEDWNDIPPLRKDYISPGR
jgi:NADH:ubiquinone oxidoreductase subunit C